MTSVLSWCGFSLMRHLFSTKEHFKIAHFWWFVSGIWILPSDLSESLGDLLLLSDFSKKNNPVYETAKETLMYRIVLWTLWKRERVGRFGRVALKHVEYHVWNELPVQVRRTILDAWGWCTGTTRRDGMGTEKGGGFRMGSTCIPVLSISLSNSVMTQYEWSWRKKRGNHEESLKYFSMDLNVYVCSVAHLCLTLCDRVDCSLPGSSVHENFQATILRLVAISSSRGSSQPRDQTRV